MSTKLSVSVSTVSRRIKTYKIEIKTKVEKYERLSRKLTN